MEKPSIELDLKGPEGNIFVVLGKASQALHDTIWEMESRVKEAYSYEDALCIINEYVTIKQKGGLPMK